MIDTHCRSGKEATSGCADSCDGQAQVRAGKFRNGYEVSVYDF